MGVLAEISGIYVALYAVAVLLGFLTLIGISIFFLWLQRRRERGALSPYTGTPLRRASEISYWTAIKVLKFLYYMHQYDNRIFDLNKAAVCRETGRIFPNCINRLDIMHVDWNFLSKRHPGNYVSWGSLTLAQQEMILKLHGNLKGFQTEESSPTPSPRRIERPYVYTIPGPLYVDIEKKTVLGWVCVPETDLEVLVVQKPLQYHMPNVSQEEHLS